MIVLRRLYSRRANAGKIVLQNKKDPGIFERKKLLEASIDELDDVDIDDFEADFMNVHMSHKAHLAELEARKEQEKFLIVKQKYFKEKLPNFLTWHDKEQIQYLYNKDPEEWNIETLSEGFPTLPHVIEKIVKRKWTKKDKSKISNHDKTVLQNWNDFKQGKFNHLPKELKEHLQKFSQRTLKYEPFDDSNNKEVVIHQNKNVSPAGEFSEIISSYQKLKEKNVERKESSQEYNRHYPNLSNNKVEIKTDPCLVTFKELQNRVKKNISQGKEISVQDDLLKDAVFSRNKIIELQQEDISNIIEHRHEVNRDKVGFVRKTTKDMAHLIYPEKIVIPKNIYKKACTYKLNDCYYDSDGQFLYRVPGMS